MNFLKRVVFALIGLAALHGYPVQAQDAGANKNNLVYEIFVRSFCDGRPDPHGVGDLRGVTSKLNSYLNSGSPSITGDLKVGILWLMPIFPAGSYHGYDVKDFRSINPEYGDMADFDHLIQAAHQHGVRIVLDIPFNHTSDDHPWFKAAISHPASPQRNYYHIRPEGPGCPPTYHSVTAANGDKLCYQGVFGKSFPDLNLENPQVKEEVFQIARFWLDKGVDGFRLDAAKHLFGEHSDPDEPDILKNNDFWRDFSFFVYKIKPDAVLVGEVLGERETLRRYSFGLDALVDQPFMHAMRHNAGSPKPNLIGDQKRALEQARLVNAQAYQSSLPFPDVPFHFFPYLASHDENPRLASFLGESGNRSAGRSVDQAYRLAGYYLFTVGRYPIIYNGDELMQKGWKWNGGSSTSGGDGSGVFDETLREPLPWFKSNIGGGQTRWLRPRFDTPNDGISVEEQGQHGGMLNLWRGLANVRSRHPGLANGDIGMVTDDNEVWRVFEKVQGSQRYLVLINQTGTGHDYLFHGTHLPAFRQSRVLFWSNGADKTWKDQGAITQRINDKVFVPPYGLVILQP